MEGLMWGILPVGVSLFAVFLVLMYPERRVLEQPVAFPSTTPQDRVVLREAN